ncbi:MFS transporter [Exiguobacterium sp. NG55]|uniref:MFS transporter n=1 Tax=Exiguobacterium sp. NG55 TaxID=375477 RepID=UPI00068A9904|nr:MFS transporter [Exiguobacterium sp. NG55]
MTRTENKSRLEVGSLLTALGISSMGDFIYLVAINVFVYRLTDSAIAVAGLWMIGPLASVMTKFWIGSIVDRSSLKNIMVWTDVIRGGLLIVIPFMESLWLLYGSLYLLAVAKSFFEVASFSYIAKWIPTTKRKQFNAYRQAITSGAFLIGPALSGALLLVTTTDVAIWMNSVSFFMSALLLQRLPQLEWKRTTFTNRMTTQMIRTDWKEVWRFSQSNGFVFYMYMLFQGMMILSFAMDAQEVVFTQETLSLSEAQYGLLISLTGLSAVVGSLVVASATRFLSIRWLIGVGSVLVAVGYMIYALSHSFWMTLVGFLILGFFNAFSGSGFITFYQNNLPEEMTGRIASVYGMVQSILQVIGVLLLGLLSDIVELRITLLFAASFILLLSMIQFYFVFRSSSATYYSESDQPIKNIS